MKTKLLDRHRLQRTGITLALLFCSSLIASAQFDSGSDGSDGALDFSGSPAGTVIEFDPTTFTPALDSDGDGIYHFTTITIPAEVTVRFGADKAGYQPIQWLATGAVVIEGTLNLDGENGHDRSAFASRISSIPGSGGFGGGFGGLIPTRPAQDGFGPGRGFISPNRQGGGTGSYASIGGQLPGTGNPGSAYGSAFLLPLVGGSGGAGGGGTDSNGSGGGAGGGAILIASSASIEINGAIFARGGAAGAGENAGGSRSNYLNTGGSGSGGAIRLLAPTLSGNGALNVNGGLRLTNVGTSTGGVGWIRLEARENTFIGSLSGDTRVVTLVPNPVIVSNSPLPTLRIVSIDGVAAPANPRGVFGSTDVTVDAAQSVEIVIEGENVPVGTPVTLSVINETEGLAIIVSDPLTGTEDNSTVTATVQLLSGYSLIFTNAQW